LVNTKLLSVTSVCRKRYCSSHRANET